MSWTRLSVCFCVCALARTQVIPGKSRTNDGDYNTVNTDGSFDFGYANKDQGSSYHLARANSNNVVGGRFGSRDPASGTVKETIYTAGPRGFRPKGPNIHRQMDLDQRPRANIGNAEDPYFDPNEDPSYSFQFNTRTYSKNENADSNGDVKGHYTYVDDAGERHDVNYIAGQNTGFHVSSAHPDNPDLIGSPFHHSPLVRNENKARGRTAVQRNLDGSYRFISAGPDQRRTESSDSRGNVRGSYTFLDDKGVQRTVHYIAGPGIGYRIVKNNNDPYIPGYFPTIPSAYDPDFTSAGSTGYASDDTGTDDVFKASEGTAASGHVKPSPYPTEKDAPNPKSSTNTANTKDSVDDSTGDQASTGRPRRPNKPRRPFKTPFTIKPYLMSKGAFGDKTGKNTPARVGFDIKPTKSGATIIRNKGKDFFSIPPGVSVRAHVQSIDLYPYDSKPMSPSEALEKDNT